MNNFYSAVFLRCGAKAKIFFLLSHLPALLVTCSSCSNSSFLLLAISLLLPFLMHTQLHDSFTSILDSLHTFCADHYADHAKIYFTVLIYFVPQIYLPFILWRFRGIEKWSFGHRHLKVKFWNLLRGIIIACVHQWDGLFLGKTKAFSYPRRKYFP